MRPLHFSLLFYFHLSTFVLCLLISCTQPTDSTGKRTVERERIEMSGSIAEDAVWESGKEYYVTGDMTVEQGATLTIQPDVRVLFKADTQADYYGLTVKGTLIADGGDSTNTILFTSGALEWAKRPEDWRGIEASPLRLSRTVEASSDSSSMIQYCRTAYANVGIKADRDSPRESYCVVARSSFILSDGGEVRDRKAEGQKGCLSDVRIFRLSAWLNIQTGGAR